VAAFFLARSVKTSFRRKPEVGTTNARNKVRAARVQIANLLIMKAFRAEMKRANAGCMCKIGRR
jgi:hypothetical protein